MIHRVGLRRHGVEPRYMGWGLKIYGVGLRRHGVGTEGAWSRG